MKQIACNCYPQYGIDVKTFETAADLENIFIDNYVVFPWLLGKIPHYHCLEQGDKSGYYNQRKRERYCTGKTYRFKSKIDKSILVECIL